MSSRARRRSAIGDKIGAQLRSIYNEVLNEPLPERFSDLLNQLETEGTPDPSAVNSWALERLSEDGLPAPEVGLRRPANRGFVRRQRAPGRRSERAAKAGA